MSNYGNVRRWHQDEWVAVKLKRSVSGHITFKVPKAIRDTQVMAHRYVAMAFVDGDRTLTVHHINEIPSDNWCVNLQWLPGAENTRLSTLGRPNKRTPDAIVLSIATLLESATLTHVRIAEKAGVSTAVVAAIAQKMTYPGLTW